MKARRRVAITGIGLVTPVGNDVATTWDALLAGRSGGAGITLFDASGFPVRIAAEVKDFAPGDLAGDRKLLKYADRSHRFALVAAEQAFRDAGIRPTPQTAMRWGCAVGAGMMTSEYVDLAATHAHSAEDGELHADLLLTDAAANDPRVFCRSQATTGISLLTRRFGILGSATSVHTACASGGQAVGTALKLIRRGAVDCALAGGFDSMISPVGLAGFCLLSAVSPDNATPQRASRPFDISRNGFLLGEGAGFLVLEEWEAARRRGARIYAELAGDGNSLSSYRITDSPPDGDGPIQSMRAALADAGATPADIDYLNAHGTSTPMNDKSETAATRAVFGEGVMRVNVSSTKSSMGHLIAAAGAVEAIVCALAIHRGEMPVNANLIQQDPECELNLVTGAPRRQRIRMAMSNSFGFGGSNSSVVLRNPEEVDGLPASAGNGVSVSYPATSSRRVTCADPIGRPRIVVTGTGAVCAAGSSPDAILANAIAGRSAIAPITQWDTTDWPCRVAAEIADFNPRALVEDRKLHKLIRRTDFLGLHAAGAAIERSGIVTHRDALDPAAMAAFDDRTGVYVGSGGGNYQNQYDYFPLMSEAKGELAVFGRELANMVNPMWLLRTLPNNVLGHIGIKYTLKGPNACITNHSVGGSLAVIEAMHALRNGEADRALAVGHDAPIEPQMVLYYHRLGLLASSALRPFDARHDGSLFGEGAGAMMLETEASARARNAAVLGEVLGGGYACEAQGLTAIRDDGDGLARAIEAALADAGIAADDVGMIVAHGNGTPQSDLSEARAIHRVFGASAPPVTAFKWAVGHLIAAAGILEATLALAALAQREVPGVATFATLDPDGPPIPVSAQPQAPRGNVALILCRGFAGTNAAFLLRGA